MTEEYVTPAWYGKVMKVGIAVAILLAVAIAVLWAVEFTVG